MTPGSFPLRRSAWGFLFLLSGCATVAPDSVPWLLYRQEIHDAPWWGKPRTTLLVSGTAAEPTDHDLLISPSGQYAFGIPFGDHVGFDLTLGLIPSDLKLAAPITAWKLVLYPYCSIFFRDTTLLPRTRWHYDPGMQLAVLAMPNLALKATLGTIRYSTFRGMGSETGSFDQRTDYASFSVEPIFSGQGMSLLGHVTVGYGYRDDHKSMVFFQLGFGGTTSPALFH